MSVAHVWRRPKWNADILPADGGVPQARSNPGFHLRRERAQRKAVSFRAQSAMEVKTVI